LKKRHENNRDEKIGQSEKLAISVSL